jgi:hypothetical protein
MSWNYRVIRRKHLDSKGEVSYGFAIHEVYYNADGSIWLISQNPIDPFGETSMELHEDLKHMTEALSLPVLVEEEIEFKEHWHEEEGDSQVLS